MKKLENAAIVWSLAIAVGAGIAITSLYFGSVIDTTTSPGGMSEAVVEKWVTGADQQSKFAVGGVAQQELGTNLHED